MKKLIVALMLICPIGYGAEGGYSNYLPGFYGDIALATEPPTEFSIRNDVYHYTADGGTSVRSGLLELGVDVDFTYNYTTFLHKPGIDVFGSQYAYGAVLALGGVDIEADIQLGGLQATRQDDHYGLGDIVFIPAMFFWNRGNNHFSLAQYIVAPVGDYDQDDLANSGLNYWTFETDIAMTYLNQGTGQDYSVVLGYNYNTENDDTDYQSGDELHLDYVVNQFLSETWAIGLHGFYLKQIGGDSGSGAVLGSNRAEAAGIGPALMWIPEIYSGKVAFIAKWLHEYHAERRLKGDHFLLSFAIRDMVISGVRGKDREDGVSC